MSDANKFSALTGFAGWDARGSAGAGGVGSSLPEGAPAGSVGSGGNRQMPGRDRSFRRGDDSASALARACDRGSEGGRGRARPPGRARARTPSRNLAGPPLAPSARDRGPFFGRDRGSDHARSLDRRLDRRSRRRRSGEPARRRRGDLRTTSEGRGLPRLARRLARPRGESDELAQDAQREGARVRARGCWWRRAVSASADSGRAPASWRKRSSRAAGRRLPRGG